MKLEDMTVFEILDKYDFPESFIESFKAWCQDKPRLEPKMTGLAAWAAFMASNPFSNIIKKPIGE